MRDGKQFSEYSYLVRGANAMLDDITWWTKALRDARSARGCNSGESPMPIASQQLVILARRQRPFNSPLGSHRGSELTPVVRG